MKFLIVIDMQNDFISGALGSAQARRILPAVQARLREAREAGEHIIFTRDTHGADYLRTQEGRKLPVPHCLLHTPGWQIAPELDCRGAEIFDKPGFGSPELIRYLCAQENLEQAEFIGLCTDICVITNAMMLKGVLPEVPVQVRASCCAGVSPESHETALRAMAACQIEILA